MHMFSSLFLLLLLLFFLLRLLLLLFELLMLLLLLRLLLRSPSNWFDGIPTTPGPLSTAGQATWRHSADRLFNLEEGRFPLCFFPP